MATWVGKITLACPSGRVIRRLSGTPDSVLKRTSNFDASSAGRGCKIAKVELVKRGVGAGLPDKLWHDGLGSMPAWWPFGKKPKSAKRHQMTQTVYYARTKNGSYIQTDRPPSYRPQKAAMAGARRKRKRRR